jgi:hypothetical protein
MARTTRSALTKLLSTLMLAGMLLAALSVPGSAPALAQTTTPWTTVGAAGMVDNNDLARYATEDGTGILFFADGATGTINVKYNIVGMSELSGLGTYQMVSRYRDDGIAARIILQLRRYSFSSGVTSDPLITLDTRDFPAGNSFQTQRTACFGHDFDFRNYAYYVDAIITRTAVTGAPALGAIKVEWVGCVG